MQAVTAEIGSRKPRIRKEKKLNRPPLPSREPLPPRPQWPVDVRHVIGIDFSGAELSGRTAWAADAEICDSGNRLVLARLSPLGKLAGDDHRDTVNAYLASAIGESSQTLWGIDFPFGLPIELGLGSWRKQLAYMANFAGTAKDLGRHLVQRSQSLGHSMHVRRDTDRETQTPFDCYHYRIIYQTFHGMRDVLGPIAGDRHTCVLPFQYQKFASARRWIVEACPSSTLKRLRLPHRLYKQSAGKPPTTEHQAVRKIILQAITDKSIGFIDIKPRFKRVILSDSGGDALDSVLAAVGSFTDFCTTDHSTIRRHARYALEGRVFG